MTKLRFDYTDGNGIDNDIPIPRRRSGNGSNNGIRDKWKVSRAVVGQRIRRAGGCNNSHFHYDDDNDSDVDLVDIDLRTPPTTPNAKSAAAAAAKNKKNAAAAARTMSMLTPDMLETLGLTEVVVKKRECKYESDYDHEYEYEYTHVSAVQVTTATSATATTNRCTPKKKKSVRIDENRNTTIQQSFPETPPQHREALQHDSSSSYRKNKNKRSRQLNRSSNTYDGDNDASPGSPSGSSLSSSSESSSDNSYEPIPRAPDDWTIEDLTADDDDNTILHYYRSAAGRDCDVFSCVGMVFALPLACGLMCLDNLVDTGFFTQNTSKTNSMSSPEVLAPRGTATEPSSSCNNNKTRPKARSAVNHDRKKRNQQKSERRRRSKNDDNRDDDENDAASIRDANCELFPTSIELPANKILAPCW